jgi:hypothetical protein
MEQFLQQHSGELVILVLTILVLATLLILVPQLLRAQQRSNELKHTEHMRGLEQGFPIPEVDEYSVYAGRTAMLVPMVTIITAGTVTCFIAAYRADVVFSISLAVWCVAGVVSFAAVTGGVTLLARLAQIDTGREDEEIEDSVSKKELQ